jgi:hypothetical protein
MGEAPLLDFANVANELFIAGWRRVLCEASRLGIFRPNRLTAFHPAAPLLLATSR